MHSTTAKLRSSRTRGVRYACELAVGVVLVSLLLRTWLVQGLIVPVTVSGGSMATVLTGPHHQIDCQDCRTTIRYGIERPPVSHQLRCPNCGSHTSLSAERAVQSGDSVIIDRTAFQLRHPRRWEVVVFRCPEKAQAYCVKRVVALPGESVQITGGDIHIDGLLASKDFPQVRACAQLVYDASYSTQSGPPRWQAEHADSHWRTGDDGFVIAFPSHEKTADERGDWLFYHHTGGQPVRDDYGYNQGESRLLNLVSDIGLSGHFVVRGPGMLQLKASDGRDWFHVRLAPSHGRLTLLRNEALVISLDVDLAPLIAGAEIEFWLVDRQVMLALDQQTVLRYPYSPSSRPRNPSSSPLAVGATNLNLEVRNLKILRDIYYTDPGPGRNRWGLDQPYRLGESEFFMLGDNSPISEDSRTLQEAAISGKFLVGKPLGID